MFSVLLITIGLGGAVYLGWTGADSSVVFLLALPIYVSMLITDRKRVVTAISTARVGSSVMDILKAIYYTVIVPYISGLIAVSLFFFVTTWVAG
jgi:hypothetical protein